MRAATWRRIMGLAHLGLLGWFAWRSYQFVDTGWLVALLLVAWALLGLGGACLRNAIGGAYTLVLLPLGLVFYGAGGAVGLTPGMDASNLLRMPAGNVILEDRIHRTQDALWEDDLPLVQRLANRGLGTRTPRNRLGDFLLHEANSPAEIDALLQAGLDPDVANEEGETLLMRTGDLAVVRALLDAGADTNARVGARGGRPGLTPLMAVRPQFPDQIDKARLLLQAGADPNAVDDNRRTVADYWGPEFLTQLQALAPALVLRRPGEGSDPAQTLPTAGGEGGPQPPGRRDWLLSAGTGESAIASELSSENWEVEFRIRLHNPGERDWRLLLTAKLGGPLLFTGASHGGGPHGPESEGLAETRELRWPRLTLPAGATGEVLLRALRADDLLSYQGHGVLEVEARDDGGTGHLSLYEEIRLEEHGAEADYRLFYATLVAAAAGLFSLPLVWMRGGWDNRRTRLVTRTVAGLFGAFICFLVYDETRVGLEERALVDEQQCEVLDIRKIHDGSVTSSTRSSTGVRTTTSSQTIPIYAHLLAVSATGEFGSQLKIGRSADSAELEEEKWSALRIGDHIPCWDSVEVPGVALITRGFSFWGLLWTALFGLLGVVLLALGLGIIPRAGRRREEH